MLCSCPVAASFDEMKTSSEVTASDALINHKCLLHHPLHCQHKPIIISASSNNSSNTLQSSRNVSNNNNNTTDKSIYTQGTSRNLHDILLEALDILLSCLVVAPCVIAYWRGTWELMGVLIFPSNLPLSAACSMLIGGLGHLIFTLTQNFFKTHIHPDKRRLTYYIISRCYTGVFGIVCVNMWRGAWILCDWLTSADSLLIISIVTLVSLLFMIATRTVRNLGAAPYTVTMDHKSDYFEVDTMFKIPVSIHVYYVTKIYFY